MFQHPDVVFPQTEETYRQWLQAHPKGYVVSAWKQPETVADEMREMSWHRADCSDISQPNVRYVTGDTLKACSIHAGALAEWVKSRDEHLRYCRNCRTRLNRQQTP